MSGGHDDEDVDLRSLTPRQREWALSASRLVASLVGKLAPHASEQEREDLLQDGHEGACQAARRFDPAVGARFTSYAHPFIAGAIADALKKERRDRRWKRRSAMQGRLFVAETSDQFTVVWDPREVNEIRQSSYARQLIASMIAMAIRPGPRPDEAVEEAETGPRVTEAVRAARRAMTEQERELFALRFGQGKKLDVIAEELGIAVITARRRHEALLDRLAASLHAGGVTEAPEKEAWLQAWEEKIDGEG
ncbi:MAG: sigma-70 family RNA polymerase sigma factor [Polyangiaceae bacterium]|nr:sigma-70 family RNA polymerase sigma factor [Polyangiaceae bacterium]